MTLKEVSFTEVVCFSTGLLTNTEPKDVVSELTSLEVRGKQFSFTALSTRN